METEIEGGGHMDTFLNWLCAEKGHQEAIMRRNLELLKQTPEGTLVKRKRDKRVTYHHCKYKRRKGERVRVEEDITDNPKIISELAQKSLRTQVIKNCEKNIESIGKLILSYKPLDTQTLLSEMNEKNREILKNTQNIIYQADNQENYIKRVDKNGITVHRTLSGVFVSSKSEVIIANALFEKGIPFQYDKRFDVLNENGGYYYPDFTITLPNGKIIYWEHFGLLGDKDYCKRTVEKIQFYFNNGICIGDNLIITVDDSEGNCSSPAIYGIIKEYLEPQFMF